MNKKEFTNICWMIMEKGILVIGFFLVTAYVAKYLGPSMVGDISYIYAIYQILQVISKWGSENVIFRRTSKNQESGCRCLQSSGMIRMGIMIFLSSPIEMYLGSAWKTEIIPR
ncbi:TPA: oligosaccharide flippase family protein [Klebsiella pneumoniae]|nr:oligosaccharide flippase family protein [Klebsiella pneumoniae]